MPPPGAGEETFSQPWRDFLVLEARLEGVDWSCRAEEWGVVVSRAATLPDPLGGG